MVQFYFLSVLTGLLAGCILFFKTETAAQKEESSEEDISFLEEKEPSFAGIFSPDSFFYTGMFRLVFGILCIVIAFLVLISPVSGVFLLGDLFPAIVSFAAGASILVDYYVENSDTELKLPELVEFCIVDCRRYLGIICIIVSFVHFIIPGVLFF